MTTTNLVPRSPVLRCTSCRSINAPFIYMANGKDYCVSCARKVRDLMNFGSAGRRSDDVHLN